MFTFFSHLNILPFDSDIVMNAVLSIITFAFSFRELQPLESQSPKILCDFRK